MAWYTSTHSTPLLPAGKWPLQKFKHTSKKLQSYNLKGKSPSLGSSWLILGQTLKPPDPSLALLLNFQLHAAADLFQQTRAHPPRPHATPRESGFIFAAPRTSDGQKAVAKDLCPWLCRALKSMPLWDSSEDKSFYCSSHQLQPARVSPHQERAGKQQDTNSRVPLSQANSTEVSLGVTAHLWVTLLGNSWHSLPWDLPKGSAGDPWAAKGREPTTSGCPGAGWSCWISLRGDGRNNLNTSPFGGKTWKQIEEKKQHVANKN